jgi:hypothetical protein
MALQRQQIYEVMRNYKKEYEEYHGKPKQIARRAGRNAGRAKAVKLGIASNGDGKDVHHKNNNPKDNRASNLASTSVSKNRGFPRTSKNKPKGRLK